MHPDLMKIYLYADVMLADGYITETEHARLKRDIKTYADEIAAEFAQADRELLSISPAADSAAHPPLPDEDDPFAGAFG